MNKSSSSKIYKKGDFVCMHDETHNARVLILEVLTLSQYKERFPKHKIVETLTFRDNGESYTKLQPVSYTYEDHYSSFAFHHYAMHGDNKGWLTQFLKGENGCWED